MCMVLLGGGGGNGRTASIAGAKGHGDAAVAEEGVAAAASVGMVAVWMDKMEVESVEVSRGSG